jgi:hypothetical protein
MNHNLNSTPVQQAFDYTSTIKSLQIEIQPNKISPICIYCSYPDSIALLPDGSFRQCVKCKKNFRPKFAEPAQPTLSQPVSYQTPIFQTLRPIYQPTNKQQTINNKQRTNNK